MLKKIINEVENHPQKLMKIQKTLPNKNHSIHLLLIGFYDQIISMSKSLDILIENDSISGVQSIARSVLENLAYFKLLIESEDRELLSMSYNASEQEDNLKIKNILNEKSKKGDNLRKFLLMNNDEKLEAFNERLKKIDDFSSFSEVYKFRDKKDKWYNLTGKIRTFEQLCEKLELDGYYNSIYRTFSAEVHGNNISQNFRVGFNSDIELIQGTKKELSVAVTKYALGYVSLNILQFYRMNEELQSLKQLVREGGY